MNGSQVSPQVNAGLVPVVLDGVNLIFSWIKSCEILCVVSKKRLREFIGPLAALVFKGTSADGEANREVYLKIIGETWTISVALFHWPKGSAVPYELHFPADALGNAAMRGGEGAYVTWDDRVRQEIKRFRIRRTQKDEVRLWQHSQCMLTSCKALVNVVADDTDEDTPEAPPPGTARAEGELRAAARQIEASQTAAPAARLQVISPGEALSYCGTIYKFKGEKRWEFVQTLMTANGDYVDCGKGLKGFFSSSKEARAFFDAAIEAEAAGRNGTGRYKLRV